MAREVYADPFGSYIGGYDTGMQREQQLQRGVRDARGMDWDYYNMKPIELETAQRNNAFQAFADPHQRQMLPIGVKAAQANLFNTRMGANAYLNWLGITQPSADAIKDYSGLGYVNSQDGTQFYGANGGGPVGPMITPEAYNMASPAFRTEGYGRNDEFWQRDYNIGNQDIASANARAQLINAQNQGGRGAGGNAGYFGMQGPLFGGTGIGGDAQPPVVMPPMIDPNYVPPGYNIPSPSQLPGAQTFDAPTVPTAPVAPTAPAVVPSAAAPAQTPADIGASYGLSPEDLNMLLQAITGQLRRGQRGASGSF